MNKLTEKIIDLSSGKNYFNEEFVNVLRKHPLKIKFEECLSFETAADLIKRRKKSINSGGGLNFGFEESLNELVLYFDKKLIKISEFECQNWSGMIFHLPNAGEVLACVGVKHSVPSKKTPPNWDGSLEMLNHYNK